MQVPQPSQVHRSSQVSVFLAQKAGQNGGGGGDSGGGAGGGSICGCDTTGHSVQAPQPFQVHSPSQGWVFWAHQAGQNWGGGGGGGICGGCDTTGHSVQPPQPFQVQRASQGWVFRAQKFLHKPGGDCESDCESSKTNGVCIAAA